MRLLGLFLALAFASAPRSGKADGALLRGLAADIQIRARAMSCTAEVFSPAAETLPAGWGPGTPVALPPPGAWSRVEVAVEGKGCTGVVAARVRLLACVPAWTLAAPLPKGAPLDSGHPVEGLFDPRSLGGTPYSGPFPPGALAARSLTAGQAILAADIDDPACAHAGDRVTLLIREGDVEATDDGVLLGGGADGCTLRAQHLRSGKVVRGRLSGRVLLVED